MSRKNPSLLSGIRLSALALVVFCLTTLLGVGSASAGVEVRIQEARRAFFGGTEAVFGVTVVAGEPLTGRVGWALIAAGHAVRRGEQPFTTTGAESATIDISLQLPPVKPGVVVPLDLDIEVLTGAAPRPLARLRERLWLFPDDPFIECQNWLRDLRIRVFDPVGRTVAVLELAGVPHEVIRHPSVLEGADGTNVLIVGAGLSFEDYRGLGQTLARLAVQGHRVLCLRPVGGRIAIPGLGRTEAPLPVRLELRRNDIISELDKRLDHDAWAPDGVVSTSGLLFAARGTLIGGDITSDPAAWCWVAAGFPGGGRLLICGFPVIERWEAGPTPRFLFLRILEHLDKSDSKTMTKETQP